jgi:hypothetical protein
VTCVRNDGITRPDVFCNGIPKPGLSQSCNTQACFNPNVSCSEPDWAASSLGFDSYCGTTNRATFSCKLLTFYREENRDAIFSIWNYSSDVCYHLTFYVINKSTRARTNLPCYCYEYDCRGEYGNCSVAYSITSGCKHRVSRTVLWIPSNSVCSKCTLELWVYMTPCPRPGSGRDIRILTVHGWY